MCCGNDGCEIHVAEIAGSSLFDFWATETIFETEIFLNVADFCHLPQSRRGSRDGETFQSHPVFFILLSGINSPLPYQKHAKD